MKNIQFKTHALTYNCYIFPSFQLSGHPYRKIPFNEENISVVIHLYLFEPKTIYLKTMLIEFMHLYF